jgi:hypothetical protein
VQLVPLSVNQQRFAAFQTSNIRLQFTVEFKILIPLLVQYISDFIEVHLALFKLRAIIPNVHERCILVSQMAVAE